MIKANEIVKGRFFNVPIKDQSPFRIDCIEYLSVGNGKVGMYPNIDGKVREDVHPLTWEIQDLSPIPLSPEWLERLGFLNIAGSFRKDGLYKMEFVFYVKEGILRYQTKGSGFSIELEHIQYVHQLQNLYFAFTGEELTLTTPEGEKEGE